MSMLQSILLPFPITYTLPLINNCTPIHTPCNSLLLPRSLPGEARHAMGSPMGYDVPRCHITCITMTAYLHGAAVWLEGMERCSRQGMHLDEPAQLNLCAHSLGHVHLLLLGLPVLPLPGGRRGHAAGGDAVEQALDLGRAVRELEAPEVVARVLDELEEGDE